MYRLVIILYSLFYIVGAFVFPASCKTDYKSPDSAHSDITDDSKRTLIVSYANQGLTDSTIEDEVTDVVIDIAFELERFEIVTQYDIWNLQGEESVHGPSLVDDSTIVNLNELVNCQEAVIIKILNFSQLAIPPEENEEEEEDRNFIEKIIDGIFSNSSDDYSDNIQTQLSVKIENMDIESGETLHEIDITVSHTGGSYDESREKVLDEFKKVVSNKLKRIYKTNLEVISVEGTDIHLYLGSNVRVTEMTMFKILQPDREESVSGTQMIIPGKSAGLVCVKSLGDDRNQSRIIRQWLPISPGYNAVEYYKDIYGLQLFFIPRFPEDHLNIGLQYHFKPLGSYDYGLNLRYIRITDSYDETDHGFGLGTFAAKRILVMPSLLMQAKIGVELDLPFKKDDEGITALLPVVSGTLGINAGFMLTKRTDFELNIGYRFSLRSSNWTYSSEEESYDAFWYNAAPVVDLNGFFFTLGYKFIFL